LELARRVVQLSEGKQPNYLHILAAAYAETGRYVDADETDERALALYIAQGNGSMAEEIRQARALYQSGRALREIR
jgi:hypothetical protein